jgi:2-O-(6-phospho-alpha-D-mannosyl)-D-glycerate hydrolase
LTKVATENLVSGLLHNLPPGPNAEKGGLVFHLIPHTHWDREWYLPLGALRTRLVRMVDDLIDRLNREPEYRSFFLDGQAVLLEDYLAIRPERRVEVEAAVGEGRLGTGPWYVLADELVPSGEALLRNLLFGGATARRLGGSMPVLYSPDAFGHPAVLPALAFEFGIEYGVVWRGVAPRKAERDLFWWTAPDGRPLLVYHLPAAGYEIGSALSGASSRLAAAWKGLREELIARAATRHVAVFIGADHHRAPADMLSIRSGLAAIEAANQVRISTLQEFMEAAAVEAGDLAWVSGELRDSYGYTWTLQGTHGNRLPLKRWNSEIETLLARHADPLSALAGWQGLDAQAPLLRQAWRELIQCQFHDSICGTCSDDVARALETRFTDVEASTNDIVQVALNQVVGHDPDRGRERAEARRSALVVWNPAARRRSGVTTAEITFFRRDVLVGPPGARKPARGPGYKAISLRDASGKTIPVQVVDVQQGLERIDAPAHYPDQDLVDVAMVAFRSPELGGMEAAILHPGARGRGAMQGEVRASARSLRNEELAVKVSVDGTIALEGRRATSRFTGLLSLESGGDLGDTYTYCPPPGERMARPRGKARLLTLAKGPLLGALLIQQRIECGRGSARGKGWIETATTLELRSEESFLRLIVHLDNQARDHRLRLRLPTGLRGVESVAGTQFGSIRRLPGSVRSARIEGLRGKGSLREKPVTTDPAQRYVAVAQGPRGLALLAPGFFEFELTADGDILFTLLRAVGELSRSDLDCRPGHAAWPTPTPLAQCLGGSRLELALAPITEQDIAAPSRLERLWEDAFVGLSTRWLRQFSETRGARTLELSTIEVQGDGLVLSTLKPAESGEGIVLRCFNALESPVEGAILLGTPARYAARVRADESHPIPLSLERGGRRVPFRAEARATLSFHLQPA